MYSKLTDSYHRCSRKKWTLLLILLSGLLWMLYFQAPLPDICAGLEKFPVDAPELIRCLKENFLSSPSTTPYNLLDMSLEYNPSQLGQNLIVLSLLQNKSNGFFIECGAMDGEIFSNTLYLERKYNWTGLLIESEASNYKKLTSKHRKAWSSNACLSPTTTAEKLTLFGIDFSSDTGGHTLMKNLERFKNYPGFVNTKRLPAEVQCFPLYTYLVALGRNQVDYLSLDIEGADFAVLKTVPFDKVMFKVLEVEVGPVKEEKARVRSFLEGHGYILVQQIGGDYIFIHNSLLNNLPEELITLLKVFDF